MARRFQCLDEDGVARVGDLVRYRSKRSAVVPLVEKRVCVLTRFIIHLAGLCFTCREQISEDQVYINKYSPINTKDPVLDPSRLDISHFRPTPSKYKVSSRFFFAITVTHKLTHYNVCAFI